MDEHDKIYFLISELRKQFNDGKSAMMCLAILKDGRAMYAFNGNDETLSKVFFELIVSNNYMSSSVYNMLLSAVLSSARVDVKKRKILYEALKNFKNLVEGDSMLDSIFKK